MNDLAAAIWWYLLLAVYGLAVAPISFLLFRRFPDCGLLLARPLGLLLVTYLCWILGYTVGYPFSPLGVIGALVFLAALSVCVFWPRRRRILRSYRASARFLILAEVLTIAAFLLLIQARRFDPNLDHTEMGMDLAFLRSLWKGSGIPPVDPWFAGKPINYYYGGYTIFAGMAKISGLSTGVAYNLSVSTVFMLAVSVAFVLGTALTSSRVWGLMTVLCTAVIGNLAGFLRIIEYGSFSFDQFGMRWRYLWNTSRVIYDGADNESLQTINEYPFFAEVWANLHPHMANIPWVLLFTCLTVAVLWSGLERRSPLKWIRVRWPLLLVLIISLGGLGFANLFDLPTFSALYGCAVLISGGGAFCVRRWSNGLLSLCLLVVPLLAYLFYLPFHRDFVAPLQYPALLPFGEEQNTLIRFAPTGSDLPEFLAVFGFHISVMIVYLAWLGVRLTRRVGKESAAMLGMVALVVFSIVLVLSGSAVWTFTLGGALLFSVLFLTRGVFGDWRAKTPRSERLALGAVAFCLWIWWFCEVFYIKDNYGSARMNTLFKFHFPTWLILGWALIVLASRVQRQGQSMRGFLVLPGFLLVLSLTCLVVYFLPVITGTLMFSRSGTLDGQGYIERGFPSTYKMIRYIDENIENQPVILETYGGAYQYGPPAPENAISSHTGVPTVLGWENHEGLWRGHPPEVRQRREDVKTIYDTTDIEIAKQLLAKYNVAYVYVGGRERAQFSEQGLAKFAENFPVEYRAGDVLYRVPG